MHPFLRPASLETQEEAAENMAENLCEVIKNTVEGGSVETEE